MRGAEILAAALLATATAAGAAGDPVEALTHGYLDAWAKADATTMAGYFAEDGDFMNPDGVRAKGRAEIAGFYRQAFGAGYAGSQAGLSLTRTRAVAPGVLLVDGDWSIAGARTPQGAARPMEKGRLTAVLVRRGGAWRIAALREQAAP